MVGRIDTSAQFAHSVNKAERIFKVYEGLLG